MRLILSIALMVTATLSPAGAQERPTDKPRAIPSDAEDALFRIRLAEALDRDYSKQTADELQMLSIQRSDVAVPELQRRLSVFSHQGQETLPRNAAIHADALAYVANGLAVDALCDLCAENSDLFCPYLERSLDYAEGRLNPFTLAYRVMAKPEAVVQDAAIHWANSMIGFPHFRQRLAEAMLDRYGKGPGESDWARDPIASRLKDRASPELRQSVIRFAAEVHKNGEKR